MREADGDEEEPLDPAMERVRRKLVRLMIVSSSIMIIGLGAVFAGIFYRISEMDDTPDEAVRQPLPIAATDLSSATADGDHLVLVIEGDTPRIEVRRLVDGALLAVFALDPDAPPEGR